MFPNYKDINLVSKTECVDIVRKTLGVQNVKLVDYKIEGIGGHLGFLGEYMRMEITYEKENYEKGKQYYFLKSLPISNKTHRADIEKYGMFKKEALNYSKIFERFGNNSKPKQWHPKCYLARDDLLVLEDLNLKGFKHPPFKYPIGQNHVKQVLKTLSRMHSVSFNHEKNQLGGKRLDDAYPDCLFETTTPENVWFLAGLSGIKVIALNFSKYAKNASMVQKMNEHLNEEMWKVFNLVKPTQEFQSVFVHRDLWINNVMFQFENKDHAQTDFEKPKHCILLDFQICRYLPPAIDVLTAIYLMTRRAHRQEFYEEYIEFYYNILTNELKDSFGMDIENVLKKDEYIKSLEHFKLIPLLFTAVLLTLINLPEGVLEDLYNNQSDHYDFINNVNRDDFILKYMEKDDFYRETLIDSVEDIIEYIFKIQ